MNSVIVSCHSSHSDSVNISLFSINGRKRLLSRIGTSSSRSVSSAPSLREREKEREGGGGGRQTDRPASDSRLSPLTDDQVSHRYLSHTGLTGRSELKAALIETRDGSIRTFGQ